MKWSALVLSAACLLTSVRAEVPVPTLAGHVTDLTQSLTGDQVQELEATLAGFESQHGSQVAVLIVPTTEPESIEQYSIRVAEQWKLGRRKVDDGAILVIAKNDRAIRIEVGYGLEGALNDAVCKRIISESMIPHIQAGDFYGGIQAGIQAMLQVISGEDLPEPQARTTDQGGGFRQYMMVAFVVAIGLGALLRLLLGRLPAALVTGGIVGLLAWWVASTLVVAFGAALVAFFVTLIGGLGGLGMISGGGWGSGGRGGFGGGGGGFGGGGASGRW